MGQNERHALLQTCGMTVRSLVEGTSASTCVTFSDKRFKAKVLDRRAAENGRWCQFYSFAPRKCSWAKLLVLPFAGVLLQKLMGKVSSWILVLWRDSLHIIFQSMSCVISDQRVLSRGCIDVELKLKVAKLWFATYQWSVPAQTSVCTWIVLGQVCFVSHKRWRARISRQADGQNLVSLLAVIWKYRRHDCFDCWDIVGTIL